MYCGRQLFFGVYYLQILPSIGHLVLHVDDVQVVADAAAKVAFFGAYYLHILPSVGAPGNMEHVTTRTYVTYTHACATDAILTCMRITLCIVYAPLGLVSRHPIYEPA